MKKVLRIVLIIIALLISAYLAGPKFPAPELNSRLPVLQVETAELDAYLKNKEAGLKIKPDNEGRIIWNNDSLKNKTPFCLLYLHGFSASWYEGNPVHVDFAKRYGMNFYAPLLASHGLDTKEALIDMTPDCLYESAKEALVTAHLLGQKVIVMSTSTGCTLALKLAADFPELIDGLILLSPNIAINNPAAFLLSKPWGLQIARSVYKGNYRVINKNPSSTYCHYWNCTYRLESIVYLQQLVDATMRKETFSKVNAPVLLAYYYKDGEHQDPVVRVDAMLKMYEQLKTPLSEKQHQAFPGAGTHVKGSELTSGAWKEVEVACYQFAEAKLGLAPTKEVDMVRK